MHNTEMRSSRKPHASSPPRRFGPSGRKASVERGCEANSVSLAELLAEPITQALMRADNVSRRELIALCDRLRCRLRLRDPLRSGEHFGTLEGQH